MKKLLKVRNIVILLVIIGVIVTILLFLQKGDVNNSRAHKFLSDIQNYDKFIVTLEDKKQSQVKEVYAKDNEKNIEYFNRYYSKEYAKKIAPEVADDNVDFSEVSDTYITFWNKDKDTGENYWLLNNEKGYYKATSKDDFVMEDLLLGLMDSILSNEYYNIGYEFIEGKFLFFEDFKADGSSTVKVYFENDSIKYIKYEGEEPFEFSVTQDAIPEDWTKIPEDYKNLDEAIDEDTTDEETQSDETDQENITETDEADEEATPESDEAEEVDETEDTDITEDTDTEETENIEDTETVEEGEDTEIAKE